LPEHRADQILMIGAEDDPERWGLHVEFQLEPDRRRMAGWLLKNAAFNVYFDVDVVLAVVYLTRGDYATFPDAHLICGGGLVNAHTFHALRLWEHAERIRSGDVPELAPLLVLCE